MLLIVDAQDAFVTPRMDGAVEQLEECMLAADDVVATRFPADAPPRYTEEVAWDGMDDDSLLPIVAERADAVVEKPTYSAAPFVGDRLNDGEVVYVAGFETDVCVLGTAMELFDDGYRPVVVRDACATTAGSDAHDAALRILVRSIGSDGVIPTATYRRRVEH